MTGTTSLAPYFLDKPIFPLNYLLIGECGDSAFQQTAHVDPDVRVNRAHSPPWTGRWINSREMKFSWDHSMVLRRREGLRGVLVRGRLYPRLSVSGLQRFLKWKAEAVWSLLREFWNKLSPEILKSHLPSFPCRT